MNGWLNNITDKCPYRLSGELFADCQTDCTIWIQIPGTLLILQEDSSTTFIKRDSYWVWLKCVSFYQKGKTLICCFPRIWWLVLNTKIKEFCHPLPPPPRKIFQKVKCKGYCILMWIIWMWILNIIHSYSLDVLKQGQDKCLRFTDSCECFHWPDNIFLSSWQHLEGRHSDSHLFIRILFKKLFFPLGTTNFPRIWSLENTGCLRDAWQGKPLLSYCRNVPAQGGLFKSEVEIQDKTRRFKVGWSGEWQKDQRGVGRIMEEEKMSWAGGEGKVFP